MSHIFWESPGSHLYEAGVDRGVFYPNVGPGLPWNGLVNVTEAHPTENIKAFVDGVPYRTQKTKSSFAAELSAFNSPIEFDGYDGSYGERSRKVFGLSYRTMIGNDISAKYAYKIHLVYNAMASPSPMDTNTLNSSSPNPALFKWSLSTKGIDIPDVRPASHLVIDTRLAHPSAIAELEHILYGEETAEAQLPDPTEIISIFEQHATLMIVDHGDGTWSAIGPDDAITMLDAETFQISWPSAIFLDADTYKISSF